MALSKRGLFVVLEGNDRIGKTTQAQKIVQWFHAQNKPAEMISFPYRETPVGKLIDSYCRKELQMHDRVIHLLFSANRWERFEDMQQKLDAGINLISDRYSYSGIAYSSSKKDMDFEWCRAPELGLLKPDCIIFLTSDIECLEKRIGFGDEIYENSDFQAKVHNSYMKMYDSSTWTIINAGNQSIENVHNDIIKVIEPKLENIPDKIEKL